MFRRCVVVLCGLASVPTRVRRALLISAVLIAAASFARAASITYNLVDYPLNEIDYNYGGQDVISGQIITDGTLGPLGPQNIIGGYVSWTGNLGRGGEITITQGSFQTLNNGILPYNNVSLGTYSGSGLTATPTQLIVPLDTTAAAIELFGPAAIFDSQGDLMNPTIDIEWDPNGSGGPAYLGTAYALPAAVGPAHDIGNVMSFFNVAPLNTPPDEPGSIACNNPWIIATAVPEPGTFLLLVSALVGLGVVYLRRRWAKA